VKKIFISFLLVLFFASANFSYAAGTSTPNIGADLQQKSNTFVSQVVYFVLLKLVAARALLPNLNDLSFIEIFNWAKNIVFWGVEKGTVIVKAVYEFVKQATKN